jgi:hypothetical protein
MGMKTFKLTAEITTSNPTKIESVLSRLIGVDGMIRTEYGFMVTTTMVGQSASELNHELLSALKRVDEETILRAEWTNGKETEQFFDNVLEVVR